MAPTASLSSLSQGIFFYRKKKKKEKKRCMTGLVVARSEASVTLCRKYAPQSISSYLFPEKNPIADSVYSDISRDGEGGQSIHRDIYPPSG